MLNMSRSRHGFAFLRALWILALATWLGCATGLTGQRPSEVTAQAPPASYAIMNVTVVPMDRERLLGDHTVLVRGGRITKIGPANQVEVPPGTAKIDGLGKFLIPGLSDLHVHLHNSAVLKLFIANGVTTVRNMWGVPAHLRWRAAVADGSLRGPTIITTGPSMAGIPPLKPGSPTFGTPAEGSRSVIAQKKAGYDAVKVYNQLDPAVYAAIVDTARENNLPVVGHVPFRVGLDNVFAAGQRSIEHLEGYAIALQAADSPYRGKFELKNYVASFTQVDMTLAPEVVRRTREAGVWNCVTLSLVRQFATRDVLRARLDAPAMKFVSPLRRLRWAQAAAHMPPAYLKIAKKWFAQTFELTGLLHRAGAKILLGTDTANPFIVPGFSIHQELAYLVQAGMTPFEALRTGTTEAAEFLGTTADSGTIEVGKRADLVLLHKNPLVDIGATAHIAGVGAQGEWLDRGELDQLLADVVAAQTLPKSALAEAPEWPVEGKRLLSRRFQETLDQLIVAVEALTVDVREDGTRITRAWSRALTESVRTSHMRIESDSRGRLRSAQIEASGGLEGDTTLSFHVEDGQLRVRAVGVEGTTETLEPMPDAILIPHAPLSMDTLWLKPKGSGEARTENRTALCVHDGWEFTGLRTSLVKLELEGTTAANGSREINVQLSGCGDKSRHYSMDEHGMPIKRVRETSLGPMITVAQP